MLYKNLKISLPQKIVFCREEYDWTLSTRGDFSNKNDGEIPTGNWTAP